MSVSVLDNVGLLQVSDADTSIAEQRPWKRI